MIDTARSCNRDRRTGRFVRDQLQMLVAGRGIGGRVGKIDPEKPARSAMNGDGTLAGIGQPSAFRRYTITTSTVRSKGGCSSHEDISAARIHLGIVGGCTTQINTNVAGIGCKSIGDPVTGHSSIGTGIESAGQHDPASARQTTAGAAIGGIDHIIISQPDTPSAGIIAVRPKDEVAVVGSEGQAGGSIDLIRSL